MPKPSLSQKLSKKPSRSYLSGLSDAGGPDNASVLSFRSGESGFSNRPDDDTGSPGRRRYSSMPGVKPTPRAYAASDIGMSFSPSSSSRLRLGGSTSGATPHTQGDRYSPAGGDKRRSVTFGDLNPALFNERDNLEVMSDIGGYGRSKRNRTFSVASSIDGGSDAGSTLSQSRRASVRRGSKSEKVTRTTPSMDLWHNNLGGPGLVRRSEAGGTVTSTSNPASAIVQRKSTLGSPKKLLDRDPQPSRRYTMQPNPAVEGSQPLAASSSSHQAQTAPSSDHLGLPKDGRASPTSSKGSSPATSEASFGLRTKVHSRHSQKQRIKSGLEPVGSASANQTGSSATALNGTARPVDLKRSNSASSTGSKKSTRSTTSTSSAAKGSKSKTLDLHANTLKNNLMSMPTPPTSPSKKKVSRSISTKQVRHYSEADILLLQRTPEQVVEALAKAGLLERVMEVVQEADEEESGVSSTEGQANISRQQQASSPAPQPGVIPTMQSTSGSNIVAPSVTQTGMSSASPASMQEQPTEPTRAEMVQTPASESEFQTPPSTPPDTPIATDGKEVLWGSDAKGADTPKQAQPTASVQHPASIPISSSETNSQAASPISVGPYKQTDVIIAAGVVPVPTSNNGPPVKLETLSAHSTFDPHLVSRSLQGTVLVLAYHDLAMVFARLTWNNWANYEEVAATPILPSFGSAPEELKRYQFSWSLPPGTNSADVQLALRLENGSTNQAHWDNNNGQNYVAMLSPIKNRGPSPSTSSTPMQSGTPTASGNATPTSTTAPESVSAVPPRVFLVRTQSDDSQESNVLYDPNRRSLVIDGQVMNFVPPPSSEMQQSAIPFPAGTHASHPINIETASTGSSYSVPTPSASLKDGVSPTQSGMIIAAGQQKQMSPEEAAAVERAALNTSLPPSRTHSISSRASGDSTNAPFHYPSRAAAYQASALQQQSSLRRRHSRDLAGTPDMPNIMTALETKRAANGPDDLSGLYTSQGRNVSNSSLPNGNAPAMIPVRSPTSDVSSIGGQSQSNMSQMSVPTAPRLNTKMEPKPFSMSALTNGKVVLPTTNSTMRALTLTSNATQTLGRSFWRNNTQKTLRQNPKLPDHLNGKLGSSATITYSNLTPVPHKVRGDECLVQVFACALDFWDRAKVEILHTRGQGYGFVPGRAFVGKVLECGNDVDSNKVKRGDFVYGLADLRRVSTPSSRPSYAR